jgi:serine/threonine-protein kinase
MLPAMRGVAAAHAQGVIHRDIKPHNIFLCLDADGSIREVKVLDFGVSKLTVVDAATVGDITLSGNVVGTPEYMAPEQIRAGKEVDHRIDVYSLGVVLYEMLAGRPPYVNQHFSGLMLEIMQRDPPPLSRFRPDVPRRLAGVISRAMKREPEQRFADVPTFIQALEMVARDDLRMVVGTPPEGVITRAGFPRPMLTPTSSGSRKIEIPLPNGRVSGRVVAALLMVVGLAAFAAALRWRFKSRAPDAAPAAVAASTPASPEPPSGETPRPAAPPPAPLPTENPSPLPGAPPSAAAPVAPAVEAASHLAAGADAKRLRGHRLKAKPAEAPVVPSAPRASPVAPPPAASVPHPRPARAGSMSVDDF